MMGSEVKLVLGLDLGTTSVKAVLLKTETREVVQSFSKLTNADVSSDVGALGSEQDVVKIVNAAEECVKSLDHNNLKQVSIIAISGQMHGCVLWTRAKPWTKSDNGEILLSAGKYSRLYTWQDSRCSQEFLSSLPAPDSHLRVATGHGCASLFWLQKQRPEYLGRFNRAGTVMDFMVSALCDLDHPVMSVQNASSWGYFDTKMNQWNMERLSAADFPTHLLPEVRQPGCIVGCLHTSWMGLIPAGVQVSAAMGDLACSVLPSLELPTDAGTATGRYVYEHAQYVSLLTQFGSEVQKPLGAGPPGDASTDRGRVVTIWIVVNIGTSAQLVTRAPQGFEPQSIKVNSPSPVEYFPFFDGQYLKVAAALNGGNAIAAFIDMLYEWVSTLGGQVSKESLYDKAISAADLVQQTDLIINPTLLGERHQPDVRASVSNILTSNLTLGHVMRALCHGVVSNLSTMLSRETLVKDRVLRIVGCGSALTRNAILQEELERIFGLPVVYKEGGNAAVGAAMAVILFNKNKD